VRLSAIGFATAQRAIATNGSGSQNSAPDALQHGVPKECRGSNLYAVGRVETESSKVKGESIATAKL